MLRILLEMHGGVCPFMICTSMCRLVLMNQESNQEEGSSEHGVYGLTRIFIPLSTYDSVVFYAHSVDA